MRDRLRVAGLAAAMAVRAGGWRAAAILALNVLDSVGVAVVALLLKLLVDAARAGDVTVTVLSAVGLTTQVVIATSSQWTAYTMRMAVDERARQLFDDELMGLTLQIPTLEPHERAEFIDRMDLLRANSGMLTGAIWTLYQNTAMAVQISITVVLLGGVHPLLLVLPLFGIPPVIAGSRAERLRQDALDRTAEIDRTNAHIFDLATTAAAGKEVRLFGLQDTLLDRREALWARTNHEHRSASIQGAAVRACTGVLFAAAYVGAVVFALQQVRSGVATPGDVLLTAILAGRLQNDVAGAVGMARNLTDTLATATRYLWLRDYARDAREQPPDPAPVPDTIAAGIAVEHVSFRYADGDEALSDVNLFLPAGSTVAFVGENGAGKTTLVKLLCRLYDPDRGSITIDGIDLKNLPLEDYQAAISAAFQDFGRPELLLREAVTTGDVARVHDGDAARLALAQAGATTLQADVPAGLETQLGRAWDGGVDLSLGQWQKVAIARALMRRAPLLLVLDEPTASLDPQTEHDVFARYRDAAARSRVTTGAITLLVSHRFSTVRMADLIVVFQDGRVIEQGTHAELIRRDGLYAELFAIQARAYRH